MALNPAYHDSIFNKYRKNYFIKSEHVIGCLEKNSYTLEYVFMLNKPYCNHHNNYNNQVNINIFSKSTHAIISNMLTRFSNFECVYKDKRYSVIIFMYIIETRNDELKPVLAFCVEEIDNPVFLNLQDLHVLNTVYSILYDMISITNPKLLFSIFPIPETDFFYLRDFI
jgi:hypothetical protein